MLQLLARMTCQNHTGYRLQATGYRLQATGTVIKYAVDIAVEHLRGTRVMKSMELRRHV
jgi:hypothetical protein